MPDGQHQAALGQCRYADHKKNIFGTSTSTSTTVSCSRKVLLLACVVAALCIGQITKLYVYLLGVADPEKGVQNRHFQLGLPVCSLFMHTGAAK